MKSWKRTEKTFEDVIKGMGKDAFIHRFADTATVARKGAFLPPQPSDYLVTLIGAGTFYAEVKHTEDKEAFHFSNIQKGQMTASRRIVKAGGDYFFFIKSEHHGVWFCVPAVVIHNAPMKHLKWEELEPYIYDIS